MVRTPTKSNQPANSRATSSKVQPTFDYQGFIDEVLSRLCVEDIYTEEGVRFIKAKAEHHLSSTQRASFSGVLAVVKAVQRLITFIA
jgi:hypothetical protein